MTTQLESAAKEELARIEQQIGQLQDRRALLESLLAGPSDAPAKAARKPRATGHAMVGATGNGAVKSKGWPKGMPRDKAKRAAWFETEAGKAYLAENPDSKAT